MKQFDSKSHETGSSESSNHRQTSTPLPRGKRKPVRATLDRGLPPDTELEKLARIYLEHQAKHWPDLEKKGLIASPAEDHIKAMVEDFKERHRGGKIDPNRSQLLGMLGIALGGSYCRYSCDNSSPTSILDQLTNALRKAREEKHFVPWEYVYCDYAQSGLSSNRQGYSSYKTALSNNDLRIVTTYIDDFTRASRDTIEWWRLANLSKRLSKRLIGASDGFNLTADDWDMKITMYGLISRLFMKSLREKVGRGMRGAASRGTCVGLPPLGFTRKVATNEFGDPRLGPDELPIHDVCIDPVTSPILLELFELFTQKKFSRHKIVKYFNATRKNDSNTWTSSGITKLLENPSAIGVFIWNKSRREYDYETEKWTKVPNHRSEWIVNYDKELAIIPMEWWRTARRMISQRRFKNPRNGRKQSKNQASASTLFSGTLLCGCCGRELTLYRSHGKYKVMSCPFGATGAHGCSMSSSKSTRIIENSLLGFLRNKLLDEDVLQELVQKANGYLSQEASRPKENDAPLRKKLASIGSLIRKLFQRLEAQEDPNLCDAYDKRITELKKEETELKHALSKIQASNVAPPPPLNTSTVSKLLVKLRDILNQEIPLAAETLRALTGPITINHETEKGKRGAKWVAHFTPTLLKAVTKFAKEQNYPEAVTLEYLCSRNWITSTEVTVVIFELPIYQQYSDEIARLCKAGHSDHVIAKHLGITVSNVFYGRHFALSGRRPKQQPARKRTGSGVVCKYKAIADEVVRLRDEEHLLFSTIAKRLKCNPGTVQRAYDFKQPQYVNKAMMSGKRPYRGRTYRTDAKVITRLRRLLKVGLTIKEIARKCSISDNTVRRENARIKKDGYAT